MRPEPGGAASPVSLRPQIPEPATLMDTAGHDLPACSDLPAARRARPHATNPIKRRNGEFRRRTKVVRPFPDEGAIPRPAGASLREQSGHQPVQPARYPTPETIAPIRNHPITPRPALPGT